MRLLSLEIWNMSVRIRKWNIAVEIVKLGCALQLLNADVRTIY